MLQYIVILGALITAAGSAIYIREVVKGKIQPNRVTWLVLSIAPLLATWAAFINGARWSVLPIFMSWFIPFLIFLSTFTNKKSYRKLTIFDYLCGGASILGLILSLITKEPILATIFAVISDLLGFLPTIIKAWKQPKSESIRAYVWGAISAWTTFFALKTGQFTEIAFPIYLMTADIFIIAIMQIRKERQKV